MINPLNELSSVYSENIAEGCGCDEKKKEKKAEMLPQGKTPMGGDGARPGKNSKEYVEPMGEGYGVGDVDQKVGAVTAIPKKEQDAARQRLLAKAKAKREAMKEGHCEEEGVECSPTEKKKDSKKMKEDVYHSWREGFEFLDEIAAGGGTYSGLDNENNLQNPKAKTDDRAGEKIVEKNIKNKIKINPPQGMAEAFAEIGATLVEMYEIDEKIDLKKADMGEVIKDFRKSDAPQFQGKSKEKKRQMAIAAKLEADEEGGSMSEETEEEKKKRELMARTKDHDDKRDGKLAESDFPKDAPSIKDAKPRTKTHVKRYPGLGYAPTIKKEMKEGRALAGVISTIRSKNGMDKISSKGKDKLQDKKEKTMCEVAPLVAIPAAVAKGAAIAGKVAATTAKVGAKAAKVGAKVAKATGKAGAKVGKAVKKVAPQPSSKSSNDSRDLSGVKDAGVKVAKKVIDTGVNMVKNPLKQSFSKLTTNEELSIDDQMRISREANKKRNPNPDHRAIRAKQMKNSKAPKDTRSDAQKMTDATGPRPGSRYRGD